MELWKLSVAADGFFACGGKSSTTDNAEIVNLSCLRNIQFEDTNAGGESEAVEILHQTTILYPKLEAGLQQILPLVTCKFSFMYTLFIGHYCCGGGKFCRSSRLALL